MKDYKQYNDQLFSRWAPIYDGFELLLSGIRKEVVREINPKGKSVLDVATGTGSLAIALSTAAKQVVAIDLSAEMLAVAKKKKAGSNLSFQQMDASKMDFADNQFDVVTISLGLHDMPLNIRTAVLQEVKRVLKPNGKVYIFEHSLPPNKLIQFLSINLINTFESRYFKAFLQSDFEGYLSALGFRIERKTDYLMKHLQLFKLSVN